MACCGGSTEAEKEQAVQNKKIERMILKDKKELQRTIKLLLLGAGESGKSTFAKQMKIIHMDGFTKAEEEEYADLIRENIYTGMKKLLEASAKLKIPLAPANSGARDRLNDLSYAKLTDTPLTAELVADIKALYADDGIKKTLVRRDEFQFSDSAEFYFRNIDRIAAADFSPTREDILLVRAKTTGIIETQFKIKDNLFKMVDVGGQRNERSKWIHCFEDVTAILFFVGLSAYNQVLEEADSVNRMHEALQLFKDTINHKFFRHTNIILFLNKKDLFDVKILKVDLKVCFEDYTGGLDGTAAFNFIRDRFMEQDKKPADSKRELYVHGTCATDTDGIRKVFNAVQDIFMREMLDAAAF